MASPDPVETFIARWQDVTASELATEQSFIIDLCRLLDVPEPHHAQDYMFERPVTFRHGDGGSFVLEAKKLRVGADGTAPGASTKGFDDALLRARSQSQLQKSALAIRRPG